MEKFLTCEDVAELIGLSKSAVRGLVYRNEITYTKLGERVNAPVRFKRSDVEAWLEAHTFPAKKED